MSEAHYQEIDGIRCYAPELARAYTDYPSEGFEVTAAVEASSFWCRTRNRVLRRVFERFTDRSQPLDVLEIGCGIGGVIGALRAIPNLRLTGSEIYLQGLHYAKAKMPDAEFIQLDATNIPFRDAFDAVGAFDVLEHIPDDELVMRQVRDSLRPGGIFVATVPQYQWMWSTLDEIVHHKRRYSRRQLVERLQHAGFEVIYATSFVTALFPFMLASRLRDRAQTPQARAASGLADRVTLPGPLNRVFDWVSRVDEVALRLGATLPFGGSLLVVARRSRL